MTNWSPWARSSPSTSKNELTVSFVRPLAAQITLPVMWSHTTVRYRCPFLYFTSSIAIATQAREQVDPAERLGGFPDTALFTARQLMP